MNNVGIILMNPKYPHNVGATVRAASCFGAGLVAITGERVPLQPYPGYRLPREERMKGYKDVTLTRSDEPFEMFEGFTPVAVEVRDHAESLVDFVHPEKAVYVFGPEDGSLTRAELAQCHRFVYIPTRHHHCLNLGASVYVVLYDRVAKILRGGE
jgi:tRNA C32,U32 (ribose-2'-O)-methylase TrmJ